ncbi:hypothetical protein ACJJTC_009303 [Scirpophaga incertulas]
MMPDPATIPNTEETKTTIRKTIEIDPNKIRVVTLNPEEQVKLREEESRSGVRFPFQCSLCYKGFNFEAKLDNHMKKHDPSRGAYKCDLCHVYLPTTYSFNVHNLIHTMRYECRECGRRMIDRSSIVEHYRTQHEGHLTLFTCHICGKISKNNKTHRGHMRNHHGGDRPKCEQCGNTFINKDALTEHLLIHQGIKNFECDVCGKRFRTRTQIKIHQIKHSDSRDFYCVECDVRFKSSYTLRQHYTKSLKHKDWQSFKFGLTRSRAELATRGLGGRAARPGLASGRQSERTARGARHSRHTPRSFFESTRVADILTRADSLTPERRCPQCPSALATKASLVKHVHSVHRGRRPPPRHVCDTCGKAFRGKSVLTNHVRTHTGEKPFSCSQCGRSFTQRTAMMTHVKLVHLKIRRTAKIKPDVVTLPPQPPPAQDAWGRPPHDLYFHVQL